MVDDRDDGRPAPISSGSRDCRILVHSANVTLVVQADFAIAASALVDHDLPRRHRHLCDHGHRWRGLLRNDDVIGDWTAKDRDGNFAPSSILQFGVVEALGQDQAEAVPAGHFSLKITGHQRHHRRIRSRSSWWCGTWQSRGGRSSRRAGAAVAVAAAGPFRRDAAAATRLARSGASPPVAQRKRVRRVAGRALAVIRQVDTGHGVVVSRRRIRSAAAETRRSEHDVPADRIALGSGSADLLRTLAGAYLDPRRGLIVAHPTCDVISRWAVGQVARIRRVPLEANWSHDLAAMLRSCDDTTAIVYVCNPNNPTGSLTRRADIDSFLAALPATTLLIVDEAYHDYVIAGDDHASFLDRPVDDERIIVVRSFSKAYALAGLRVGYVVASPRVVERMVEAAGSPTVSSTAALAAAAALDDRSHLRSVVSRVADDRQEFYNQANARMLRVIDSHANFVMLNTTRRAADIVNHFARNGIALPTPVEPLGEYVRVTLGAASDMQAFWRVWDLMSMAHTL